jgi:hypothetical protein
LIDLTKIGSVETIGDIVGVEVEVESGAGELKYLL